MTPVQRVSRAYDVLVAALAVLAAAALALAFILIILDVTIRTLGVPPPAYTTAVVEYTLLYIAMFAAPYLVRKKAHVFIDALSSRLTGRVSWVVAKFAYGISIVSSLLFAYEAARLFVEAVSTGMMEERGIDIPMWLLYLPIPIGFFFVAVEFGRYLVGIDTMYTDRTKPRDTV